jgi:hypothetical protein
MSHANTIYNQLLQLFPGHDFDKLVEQYGVDRYVKNLTTWRQFITLLYAQIKGHNSLRDIVAGLNTQSNKWYHIGLDTVARSTLSDANNKRDHRVFEGLFYHMLERCRSLTPSHGFKFKNPLYTIDSTVIDLCLSVFPWAKFRRTKGALKIHCLLDHRGCIPSFLVVTEGKKHDFRVVKETGLPLIPDSIICMDRGYLDMKYLYSLHSQGVFFVIRAKKNVCCEILGQHEIPNRKGLLGDFTVQTKNYPEPMRLVVCQDEDTGNELVFLTNNFKLAASTIADIYKARWQIELFFKWIKQNLKIKSFLGTSYNAVMTQIWVAMCYYLLLSYIKFQCRYRYSLLCLARILRESLMERMSLVDILSLNPYHAIKSTHAPTVQLALF